MRIRRVWGRKIAWGDIPWNWPWLITKTVIQIARRSCPCCDGIVPRPATWPHRTLSCREYSPISRRIKCIPPRPFAWFAWRLRRPSPWYLAVTSACAWIASAPQRVAESAPSIGVSCKVYISCGEKRSQFNNRWWYRMRRGSLGFILPEKGPFTGKGYNFSPRPGSVLLYIPTGRVLEAVYKKCYH